MTEDNKQEYKRKLINKEEAAALVNSGDMLYYGEFSLFPKAIDEALAERVNDLENIKVYGVTYTSVPKIVIADPHREHFVMRDMHFGVVSRHLSDRNLCEYVPITYHHGPRLVRKYIEMDIVFLTTGPMDSQGFFNLGIANSATPAVISKAKKIVVEVNNNVPTCLGGNSEALHISQVDYVVEGKNEPLIEVVPALPTDTDRKIAKILMNEIEDECCLQLGIGGLPNAVGELIADSDLKDLGIHSEMMMDAFVDLYEKGRITGAKKNIDKFKMVYTFALGTKKLYDFIDNNALCASYPVNYANDPRMISLNDKVFAVNNALEVDLLSQVSSETMGARQISGTGGQLDFILGAFNSHGGKGLICLSSTYTDKEGNLHSRICSTFSMGSVITVPRSIVQYIVTEYGIAQLKGLSTWQRAEEVIKLAHPKFRDDLIKDAQKLKIWQPTNKIAE